MRIEAGVIAEITTFNAELFPASSFLPRCERDRSEHGLDFGQ